MAITVKPNGIYISMFSVIKAKVLNTRLENSGQRTQLLTPFGKLVFCFCKSKKVRIFKIWLIDFCAW